MKKLLSVFWKSSEKPKTRPLRRVHMGIDYGTSTSKIVIRDYGAPGGERSMIVSCGGSIRIPSGVCLTGNTLEFGTNANPSTGGSVHQSVKMRVAVEATGNSQYYFGPSARLPEGFTACDLAVLSVWHLISEGHRAVARYLGGDIEGARLGMTMGVPMAFFDDEVLRACFLLIARRAWLLYREEGLFSGRCSIDEARRALESYPATIVPPTPSDQIRDWLRSEGEAAMWWPFQSPAIGPGPYAKLDIGAGTTHASMFRIYGDAQTTATGMAFFGASTVSVGMDAVDRALATTMSVTRDCLTLRGQEQSILLRSPEAQTAILPVRERIYQAYRRAWIDTFRKIEGFGAERAAWQKHRIFLIGGGSLVPLLADTMRIHPSGGSRTVQAARLEPPPDLVGINGGRVTADQMPFVAVAYGLANIGLSIPEALTPAQVHPMPVNSRRELLDRDDIYAK